MTFPSQTASAINPSIIKNTKYTQLYSSYLFFQPITFSTNHPLPPILSSRYFSYLLPQFLLHPNLVHTLLHFFFGSSLRGLQPILHCSPISAHGYPSGSSLNQSDHIIPPFETVPCLFNCPQHLEIFTFFLSAMTWPNICINIIQLHPESRLPHPRR